MPVGWADALSFGIAHKLLLCVQDNYEVSKRNPEHGSAGIIYEVSRLVIGSGNIVEQTCKVAKRVDELLIIGDKKIVPAK